MSEVKYANINSGAYEAVDAVNGVVARLNPSISQGVDKSQRIGNRIRYKYLQFRLVFWIGQPGGAPAGTPILATFRFLIIQMRITPSQGYLVGPSAAEIFNSATTSRRGLVSAINNQNVRVIMDKTRMLGALLFADETGMPSGFVLKKKVRISNNVNYASGADLYPLDPKDNYYFIVLSDIAVANQMTMYYMHNTRISFIDV